MKEDKQMQEFLKLPWRKALRTNSFHRNMDILADHKRKWRFNAKTGEYEIRN